MKLLQNVAQAIETRHPLQLGAQAVGNRGKGWPSYGRRPHTLGLRCSSRTGNDSGLARSSLQLIQEFARFLIDYLDIQ